MSSRLTTEQFVDLSKKTPTMLQSGLAAFITETTGKKVTAQTVATVQRFLAPYRNTEHFQETKEEWRKVRQAPNEERRAAIEARRLVRLQAQEAKARKILDDLAALREKQSERQSEKPGPVTKPKPKSKSRAAKAAEKAAADEAKREEAKARLHLVKPAVDEDEADDEFVAPTEITLAAPAAAPETDDEDEDFGLTQGEQPAEFPVIVFEDGSDDDDDDDDF